jgi:hypothetical protein
MDKWKLLRLAIAKQHKSVEEKYLTGSTKGEKADRAKVMNETLESVWRTMDAIDELEKKEKVKANEPNNNKRKSHT